MARRIDTNAVALRVPGLYERVRTRELVLALAPDPRTYGLDPGQREDDGPTYSPTVLNQTEALLAREPVRVPRWWLGGRMVPEAGDWAAYRDRRTPWFTLTSDDVLTPLGPA